MSRKVFEMKSEWGKLGFSFFIIIYIGINNYLYIAKNDFTLYMVIMNVFLMLIVHLLYAYIFNASMYVGGATLDPEANKISRTLTMIVALVAALVVLLINLQ